MQFQDKRQFRDTFCDTSAFFFCLIGGPILGHTRGHDIQAQQHLALYAARPYLCIATAFVYAADAAGVAVRWGGAWHIPDIRVCADKDDPGKTMLALYKATRKRQGRKVFLDLGHFELA